MSEQPPENRPKGVADRVTGWFQRYAKFVEKKWAAAEPRRRDEEQRRIDRAGRWRHAAEQRQRDEEQRRIAQVESKLGVATHNWTAPIVIRTYVGPDANQAIEEEAAIFMQHAYAISGSGQDGGHLHAGRLLMTGGLSVLAGRRGIRSQKSIDVTYLKS